MPGLPMIKALWAYRGFIWSSVMREFHGRYRESLLGAFWSVANPLTMIVIYTVIFGKLMRASLPGHESTPFAFSIYLCAGVITWGLFAETLGRLNNVFLDNGNLIKKSNFPRICLPAISILSSLINFGILLAVYLIFGSCRALARMGAARSNSIANFAVTFCTGVRHISWHSKCLLSRCWSTDGDCSSVLVLADTNCLYVDCTTGRRSGSFKIQSYATLDIGLSRNFSRPFVAKLF